MDDRERIPKTSSPLSCSLTSINGCTRPAGDRYSRFISRWSGGCAVPQFQKQFERINLTQLGNHHVYLKLMIDGQPIPTQAHRDGSSRSSLATTYDMLERLWICTSISASVGRRSCRSATATPTSVLRRNRSESSIYLTHQVRRRNAFQKHRRQGPPADRSHAATVMSCARVGVIIGRFERGARIEDGHDGLPDRGGRGPYRYRLTE